MEYTYKEHWRRMDDPPSSGTRCLVTDGDVIIIATYLSDTEKTVWIFAGIEEKDSKSFDVQGWMPLPRPVKKIIKYEEIVEYNKKS